MRRSVQQGEKNHTQKWRRLENTLLSRAVVLKFQPVSSPGGLVHTGSWAPPWSFWFSRSGVQLRICISDKHSGDSAAAASGTTHWELPLQSPVCPEVVSGLIASVSPGSLLGCRVSGPAPDLRPLFLPLSFCDFGPDHLPKPPFQRSLITGSTSYDCFVSLMCIKFLEQLWAYILLWSFSSLGFYHDFLYGRLNTNWAVLMAELANQCLVYLCILTALGTSPLVP